MIVARSKLRFGLLLEWSGYREVIVLIALLSLAAVFLAYANGANDNFKGVATLYGCNVVSYRQALVLTTCATLAGSLSALLIAKALMVAFSGKGLVPDAITASPSFSVSVGTAAAVTVMLATVLGLPISTTHALVGAIAGAGFAAIGSSLKVGSLVSSFLMPLFVSPLLAISATMAVYWILHTVRKGLGVTSETCICIEPGRFVTLAAERTLSVSCRPITTRVCGTKQECVDKYCGTFLGFGVQDLTDRVHYLSSATICFARGLNDTPKILGLLFIVQAFDIRLGLAAIGLAMILGGIVNAAKVAETISKRVTQMNDGQALAANLVTASLLILATPLGLPVSTTHVSVGAITGVGLVRGTTDWRVLSSILSAWLLTLPIAALVAYLLYMVAR